MRIKNEECHLHIRHENHQGKEIMEGFYLMTNNTFQQKVLRVNRKRMSIKTLTKRVSIEIDG
jgi:hypothetical protein